jgi:AhpD family alkylhydroperoxidase
MNTEEQLAQIKKEIPNIANAFNAFFLQLMKDGALNGKTKELIALGIAVAQRCESCIRIHVKKCLAAGCTREEILESAGVAVLMQGGPAYTNLPIVLDSLKSTTD